MMGEKSLDVRDEVMRSVRLSSMVHKNLTKFKREALNKILAERQLREQTDCHMMERVNRDNFQTYLDTLCIRKENTYAKFTDDKEGKVIPQGVIFERLRSEITNKISNAVLQSAE
jgi:ATP-dependent RNA circularization protein (DNA/RNA ligase family)